MHMFGITQVATLTLLALFLMNTGSFRPRPDFATIPP